MKAYMAVFAMLCAWPAAAQLPASCTQAGYLAETYCERDTGRAEFMGTLPEEAYTYDDLYMNIARIAERADSERWPRSQFVAQRARLVSIVAEQIRARQEAAQAQASETANLRDRKRQESRRLLGAAIQSLAIAKGGTPNGQASVTTTCQTLLGITTCTTR